MAYCTQSQLLNLGGARPDGSGGMRHGATSVRARFCGQSAFAAYALVVAHTVVPAPDDVPFEVVAPLGCGVRTGAGTVLNALQPEPGSSIAVSATGSVGLSAIMAAKVAGCEQIIAIDPNRSDVNSPSPSERLPRLTPPTPRRQRVPVRVTHRHPTLLQLSPNSAMVDPEVCADGC
jgi:Zn-dependent alcohol dehydrogenase